MSPEAVRELDRASTAFRDRHYDEALKHFQKAVELARDYKPRAEDHLDEAQGQIQNGDAKGALEAIDKALALDAMSADAHYLRGHVHRLRGEINPALEALDKALALKPDHSGAAGELWTLLQQAQEYDLAVRKFQELAQKAPEKFSLLYYLGKALLANGSYEKAAETLSRAAKLRPEEWAVHQSLVHALKQSSPPTSPLVLYESLAKTHPQPTVKLVLADLYLEEKQRDKAVTLLRELARADSLDSDTRFQLAKTFDEARLYAEAADQAARVQRLKKRESKELLQVTFEYGKILVKAGKYDEGIRQLEQALALHHRIIPSSPGGLFFHLGNAHYQAGRRDQAEMYFRQFHDYVLTTGGTDDPETLASLGDIYCADDNFRAAVEVLERAVAAKPKEHRYRLQFAKALLGLGKYPQCIAQAQALLGDKELEVKARMILARAYLGDRQPERAVAELRPLENQPEWNDEAAILMGRALLAGSRPKPNDALKYINRAYDHAHPPDESLKLLYAQVLDLLNRFDEARALYKEVVEEKPESVAARVGLGDLEMRAAEKMSGRPEAEQLRRAVELYLEARDLKESDPVILAKLGRAERDLAQAEAELRAGEKIQFWVTFTVLAIGVLLAIFAGFWLYLRSFWAGKSFESILKLEAELTDFIRSRARLCWQDQWQARLAEEPFKGRIPYRQLQERSAKHGGDILANANFGHLVGILAEGWDVLGLRDVCTPPEPDPRVVILAHLSYVSDCRACLAHYERLKQVLRGQPEDDAGDNSENVKKHLTKHLHRQVDVSLGTIYEKIDLRGTRKD